MTPFSTRVDLSIVMPAHNERKRLPPVLKDYMSFFSTTWPGTFELVIVVNGSNDGTEQLVKEAIHELGNSLKIMVIPERIGKGGSVMEGLRAANGKLTGFVDADGSTSAEAFADLVDHCPKSGMIIASRWLGESQVTVSQSLPRRLLSRSFNLLVRTLFQLGVTDTQCGAKIMTTDALAVVLKHTGVTQWAFDVDMLFQVKRAGIQIVEHPTVWEDQEGSKVQPIRTALDMFVGVVRLRLLYSPLAFIAHTYDKTLGHKQYLRRVNLNRKRYKIEQEETKTASEPKATGAKQA